MADGAGNEHALLGLQRAEAYFYGKLLAVLAQTVEFQTGSHGTHSRVSGETTAVPRVLASEALRHQHLDFLPQQLFPPITKQFLHLGVDQHNLALLVHYHYGIPGCLEQPLELLFCLLLFRNVSEDPSKGGFTPGFPGRSVETIANYNSVLSSSLQF